MPRSSTQSVVGLDVAVKDRASVSADGERIFDWIEGVALRHARPHADERGTLCEIFDERWDFTASEVPFIYLVTIRPGQVKGWSVHLRQDDRLFFESGTMRLTLYDGRRASPTFGKTNVLHLGAHDRALVRIPPGVYHAVRNVGDGAALFLNLPTLPYDHANPDKYRLPSDTSLIPARP